MNVEIKMCEPGDAKAYTDHCLFHMQEKGIGGIYVHPFPHSHAWDKDDFLGKLIVKWTSEPFSPNWEVAWVAVVDGKFAGHLNLRCGSIDASKHRMRLGMGIEDAYRSMGIGSSLLKAATEWAQNQKQISWIDLSVFSKNAVAMKLYEKFGFRKTYVIEDALRLENESIDDIQMVLKV